MSSTGNIVLASSTLVKEVMNFSAAFRTDSVETPLWLISNRPGMTFPSVVIPLNGAARPAPLSLLGHLAEALRRIGRSLVLAEDPRDKNGSGDER